MLRFLVATVGPLLAPYTMTRNTRHLRKDHDPHSITVLRCTRAIAELVMVLTQYNHSELTLKYLRETLKSFYITKRAFRPYRMTKARKVVFQRKWSEAQNKMASSGREWTNEQKSKKRKQLEEETFHFAFPKMHLPSHIEEAIRRMGAPDNFTTDISELLHVENVKEAYRASNRVDYMEQMLWYNDRTTSLDYMKHTLVYLATKGYYDKDTARVLGMQNKQGLCRTTC